MGLGSDLVPDPAAYEREMMRVQETFIRSFAKIIQPVKPPSEKKHIGIRPSGRPSGLWERERERNDLQKPPDFFNSQ